MQPRLTTYSRLARSWASTNSTTRESSSVGTAAVGSQSGAWAGTCFS